MFEKIRIIALYLPQFHSIPENDEWWGKGFTEWSNVGKAKPLFKGHYQPKVPADLGYYNLLMEETRIKQAELAKEAGIEGFCYWHYWFGNGKQLLEKPFQEVVKSGKPDFPFCLGWANHTWKAKTWTPDGEDKILIEQGYGGVKDYTDHFYHLLPAFEDKRYIRVNNKPFFLIWDPDDMPNVTEFINHWNKLAIENGIEGFHFVASSTNVDNISIFMEKGFDAVSVDLMLKSFQNRKHIRKAWFRIKRALFSIPKYMPYDEYSEYLLKNMPIQNNVYPSILPNFDHSPRSGKYGQVLIRESPAKFSKLLKEIFFKVSKKSSDSNIIILRSWNEWAEGNYIEPDLKFGKGFLDALGKALNIREDHGNKF